MSQLSAQPPNSPRRPLLEHLPRLAGRLRFEPLGEFPTPIQDLSAPLAAASIDAPVFVKRDDRSSPIYGGNKVRTLEVLFAQAKSQNSDIIYSTGAYGSNHALAALLHAPRAGLDSGVILFPQPESDSALENLEVTLSLRPVVHALPHWSALPIGIWHARRQASRRGRTPFVMVPGGATPEGALGYVSAAFELAEQIARGELPCPRRIVVGVGSTCTSAGLLLGLRLCARLGIGFGSAEIPELVSVRVTPWPVTSRWRILGLAVRASRLLAQLAGDASLSLEAAELGARFRVDGRYLGRGYGYPTASGREALAIWRKHAGYELDTTYSAKAAAAVLALAGEAGGGPTLFWSTKSSVPLPPLDPAALADAPPAMRRWMERAHQLTAA